MADLTIGSAPTCTTNLGWSAEVKGSTGTLYTVRWCYQRKGDVQYDYECTCPSFKNRGTHCKHVREVINKHLRCGWNEMLEPTAKATKNHKCPKCGADVHYVRVGV